MELEVDDKWEIEDADRILKRAEEIKSDKKLLEKVIKFLTEEEKKVKRLKEML